jgi:hypothetical protein
VATQAQAAEKLAIEEAELAGALTKARLSSPASEQLVARLHKWEEGRKQAITEVQVCSPNA